MESRLKEIDTISDVQSAIKDNDPNQGLNKQGSCTAAVYFADNEVTNPVAGADLRAALVASCFLGALPPVDLRAVCFVRAMFTSQYTFHK